MDKLADKVTKGAGPVPPRLALGHLCTGCGACVAACPEGVLSLSEDDDGFLTPSLDAGRCVGCGYCSRACPILHPSPRRYLDGESSFPTFFAARLKDRAALADVSSGGAFWALAQTAIAQGGVVYGAVLVAVDRVRHLRAATLDEAMPFRRSKYLPSDASEAYPLVRRDLDEGRRVLFSGTPCQIAALNAFLGGIRNGLTTCEVVCHGIPSLKAWRLYLAEKESAVGKKIVNVIFRDKAEGWRNTCYRIEYGDGTSELQPISRHPFHAGYLKGLFYRPSCGSCRFAMLPRVADISLADFWKHDGETLAHEMDGGMSLVVINSVNGKQLWDGATAYLDSMPTPSERALASCRHLTKRPQESGDRAAFLAEMRRVGYHAAFAGFVHLPKVGSSPFGRALRKAKAVIRYRLDSDRRRVVEAYFSELGMRPPFAPPPKKVEKLAFRMLAMRDAFLFLAKKGVAVWFVNRVGRIKDPGWLYAPSAERRILGEMSFPAMFRDPAWFDSDLRELLGEKYAPDYVEDIGRIPQVVEAFGICRHEDCTGRLVNVVGGHRVTVGQPGTFGRTIHVYGRCGAFGYAVEDADTLPSQLQRALSERGFADVRVVNHGLWGGDDDCVDRNFLHEVSGFKAGDVVLFYRKHLDPRLMAKWADYGVRYLDITRRWHEAPEAKWCFYDRPGHMNAVGYGLVAGILADEFAAKHFSGLPVDAGRLEDLSAPWLARYLKANAGGAFDAEVGRYVTSVLSGLPPMRDGDVAGAIVMNCNPFTFGHRRLVERAAAEVDRLYILVVEEDRSVFPFAERLEMVKAGTSDIPNVVVAPSGRFVISSLTFPEYFMKDYVKKRDFDVSADVRTFCEKIAPPLGIKVRFVGEEPFDPVTATYNRCMAEMLPRYGIGFREVPRFALADGHAISATEVRRLMAGGDWVSLRDYVPETTLGILRRHHDAEAVGK